MSTRRARSLALQPRTEPLESRRLLAATFRGIDIDGDIYTLRLAGTGDLRVERVKADGVTPELDPSQPALISKITFAGTDPTASRLIGRVTKGPGGDGKVFFGYMTGLGGLGGGTPGALGIQAIDMPGFYLGATTAAPATPGGPVASIDLPNGVNTLRFGGADTTYTRPGAIPLNQNTTNDQFAIQLGLPFQLGTSVIVDKIVTSGQAAQPTTTGAPGQPTQDGVTISVNGRINTFQANSIEGDASLPASGFQGGGGTIVASIPNSTSTVAGEIGFIKVGNNATNFSVQTTGHVSNFYIGGETDNVFLLAVAGTRDLYFGLGLDNTTIRTHFIGSLQTNRGAIQSDVFVERNIGRLSFGGDVINTHVISGLDQNLLSVLQTQEAPTNAMFQDGGAIQQVLIAGDVTESVFVASVDPGPDGLFGPLAELAPTHGSILSDDLVFPHGVISAKVEGTIDNPNVSINPDEAFFAHEVHLTSGVVIPPNVVEPPFRHPGAPPSGHGVARGLQATRPFTPPTPHAARTTTRQKAIARGPVVATRKGLPVPVGPKPKSKLLPKN